MRIKINEMEIKDFKIIERPDDDGQIKEDIDNSREGEFLGSDQFGRWAVFCENKILKVCIYPQAYREAWGVRE